MNKLSININKELFLNSKIINDLEIKKDTEIIFEYISDFKSTKKIRDYISILLNTLNIDNIWHSRFTLMIDELNNNAIEYWSKNWDINTLKSFIKFDSMGISLKFEVSDTWNWTMHKTAREMILLRTTKKLKWFHKNNWIRWRGLFMIIEKLVDKLYFIDNKNWWLTVWIEKYFTIK